MREFGIDKADESEFRRNLWLDEMLKIEEEVRPFMSYVRKAFSAALPVGTTIEFDPYRHRHDGVEFKLSEEEPDLKFVTSLFVLTDGQPTMGITDLDKLNAFIEEKRQDGDVSIKGIFLKHEDDASDMISRIFGREHAVASTTFKQTVTTFVQIMGRTYRAQRREFRAAEKRKRLLGGV